MSAYNSSKKFDDCAELGGSCGPDSLPSGVGDGLADGAGGSCGPPPSALTVSTAPASARQRVSTPTSLLKSVPPFSADDQTGIVHASESDAPSLFARFWELRCAADFTEALAVCDQLLEVLHPSDFDSQVRLRNAYAMLQRDRLDFQGSYRTHMRARPLIPFCTEPRYVGGHHHGLAWSLMETGQPVRAYYHFRHARRFYARADDPMRVALADNNTALLLIRMNRPAAAHSLIDAARSVWESMDLRALCGESDHARALAYEAEGQLNAARRMAARSLLLLADAAHQLAYAETKATLDRVDAKLTLVRSH